MAGKGNKDDKKGEEALQVPDKKSTKVAPKQVVPTKKELQAAMDKKAADEKKAKEKEDQRQLAKLQKQQAQPSPQHTITVAKTSIEPVADPTLENVVMKDATLVEGFDSQSNQVAKEDQKKEEAADPNKLDAEEERKLKEDLDEFNRYEEFVAKRGKMMNPKKRLFTSEDVSIYKKLCRAISPGIYGIYTYQDPAQSVGIIISFFQADDQSKLAYIPIKLSDFVCVANQTNEFFDKILFSAKMIVKGKLTAIAPIDPDFSQVQDGADPVIDLVKLKDEMKFLTNWVNADMNYSVLMDIRKNLGLPKMFSESRAKPKKAQGLSFKDLQKAANTFDAREVQKLEKNVDIEMEDLTQEQKDQLDSSYASIGSERTQYCHKLYQVQQFNRSQFKPYLDEASIRTGMSSIWSRCSLMQNGGKILKYGIHLGNRGRIMLGIQSTRYCLQPGRFHINKIDTTKIDKRKLQELLNMSIYMNYKGFNAFALIYSGERFSELEKQRKLYADHFNSQKTKVYPKDAKEEYRLQGVINFSRVEFAVDLAAFIESEPKPKKPEKMTEEEKKKEAEKEAKKKNPLYKETFQDKWKMVPKANDQISCMAMMYNQLFDHSFFFNKLMMFQVMCIMSDTEPLILSRVKGSDYSFFDLSNYQAFDNEWNFYKFSKVLNVDIESPEQKLAKANALQAKLKAMKDTKDAKKAELAGAKKEEQKDKPEAKRGLSRNPQNDELKKLFKQELLKDNPKAQKVKQPIIATKANQFDQIDRQWHALRYIKSRYEKKEYGPYIIQMNRHNPKSKIPQIAEYAVIKHLDGQDRGCVVFTFGGPQFIRFSAYQGEDFALKDLIYYYNKKQITLDPQDKIEKGKLEFERKQIEGYYKTYSIYELELIETSERDKDLKYRILYELITKLGRCIIGSKEIFMNALDVLKNPVDCGLYSSKDPQHLFIPEQEIYDKIKEGELLAQQNPNVLLQVHNQFPYAHANLFVDRGSQSYYADRVHNQQATIIQLLSQCGLFKNGGISIKLGGINGLMELKHRAMMMHINASDFIKRALKLLSNAPKGGLAPVVSYANKAAIREDSGYVTERQVGFFLNAVASALIAYMQVKHQLTLNRVKAKYNKDDIAEAQRRCEQQVSRDNEGRLDTQEMLGTMVKIFTTKSRMQNAQNITGRMESKKKDQLQKYYFELINNPKKLEIHTAFKKYLASLYLTPKKQMQVKQALPIKGSKQNPGKQGSKKRELFGGFNEPVKAAPEEEEDCCYKFCISQVTSASGLRIMFEDMIARFNPKELGIIGKDIDKEIKQLSENELYQIFQTGDNLSSHGEKCFMYSKDGILLYSEQSNMPIVYRLNMLERIAQWRFGARAGMPVRLFKSVVPPERIAQRLLMKFNYNKQQIYQNRISTNSKGISTNASSTKKSEGFVDSQSKEMKRLINMASSGRDVVHQYRFKGKGEDESDDQAEDGVEKEDENMDEEGEDEFTIDDRYKDCVKLVESEMAEYDSDDDQENDTNDYYFDGAQEDFNPSPVAAQQSSLFNINYPQNAFLQYMDQVDSYNPTPLKYDFSGKSNKQRLQQLITERSRDRDKYGGYQQDRINYQTEKERKEQEKEDRIAQQMSARGRGGMAYQSHYQGEQGPSNSGFRGQSPEQFDKSKHRAGRQGGQQDQFKFNQFNKNVKDERESKGKYPPAQDRRY